MLLPLLMNNGVLGGGVPITWGDYETFIQIDTTKYTPAGTFLFEAVLKTDAGTGHARLYDITGATAVSGSQVSTASTSYVRQRSGSLTLTAGAREYKAQVGYESTNQTDCKGARVIVRQ